MFMKGVLCTVYGAQVYFIILLAISLSKSDISSYNSAINNKKEMISRICIITNSEINDFISFNNSEKILMSLILKLVSYLNERAAVVKWLRSWLREQSVRSFNPGLATSISEIS